MIANDEHYGAVGNLTAPGRGVNMGDGWETRRRREPGHDWAVLELGTLGRVSEVVVDTAHFKGNYPDRCSIQATVEARGAPHEIAVQAESWPVLLPEVKLQADHVHTFKAKLADLGPIRFVRLNIYPDGRGQPAADAGDRGELGGLRLRQTAGLSDEGDDVVHALQAGEVGEDERPLSTLAAGVAVHDREVRAHVRGQVGLVDDQQV